MPETYWQGTRESPYLEDWRRKMLQGAFDVTQVPGTVTPQGIAGYDPLQTGAISGAAGMMGIDPTTGLPTGTGAQYDPAFATAFNALGAGQATTGWEFRHCNLQHSSTTPVQATIRIFSINIRGM